MSDKQRMDVLTFKEGKGGKTFAVRLGTAVQNRDGNGWNCYLDAIPAPVEGQYRLSVVPPREKAQSGQTGSGTPPDDNGDPF